MYRARNRVESVSCARLFAVCFLILLPAPGRAEPVVEVFTQDTAGPTLDEIGVSPIPSTPLHVTVGVDMGYDDNINTSASGQGSWFTIENIALTYGRNNERTQFHFLGSGGYTHFFEGTQDDKHANVTMSLLHQFSSRLSFAANVYANYQSEPDFKTNVGPENVRANHFDTTDTLAVAYHLLPRFSLITGYTFRRIKYDDQSIGMFQDRVENTFSEVFQFSRSSRTNLFGEYRYEVINYDTAPNDSDTHFLLAGFDHKLTEHLIIHASGGESFRSSEGVDSVSPHFEGLLTYANTDHSSLNWATSYGVEPPTLAGVSSSTTFRTGLEFTYGLSARITSTAAVYYNRAENEGPAGSGSVGSQDSFDFSLGLRYRINQRFAWHIDYNRSSVISTGSTQGSSPDYSRNRYFTGLSFTY